MQVRAAGQTCLRIQRFYQRRTVCGRPVTSYMAMAAAMVRFRLSMFPEIGMRTLLQRSLGIWQPALSIALIRRP